jgi:uncharacterized membrane protein
MYYFYIFFVITIGVIFRFANLDRIIYWGDEVYSSIRSFGYTTTEIYQTIAQHPVITAATLQQFQQLDPDRGLGAILHSLAVEDAHVTPLYFLLANLWSTLFGTSVIGIRSLSVLCGVALVPVVYWLAIELFARRRVALCAAALVAISPVQLLFAQEARMYALWALLMITAGAALLRAIRRNTWGSWLGFGLAASASLYTHFLAAIPLGGYVLYTIVLHWRDRPVMQRLFTTASLTVLSFCPWVWVFLIRQVVEQEDGTQKPFSLSEAAKNWFSLFRRLFIDVNTTLQDSWPDALLLISISLFCGTIVAIALFRLQQETPIRTWLFVGLLIAGLPIGLFGQSLHGVLPSRYMLPSYVGLQLAIGYLLGTRLDWRGSLPRPHRWIWASSLVVLVLIGVISNGTHAQAASWWNKSFSECNPAIADRINQSPRPLVISDGTGGPFFDHALSNIISVARIVKPDTPFQIGTEAQPIDIAAGDFSDRFILTPSKNLRESLQAKYGDRLEPLITLTHPYRESAVCFWQLRD